MCPEGAGGTEPRTFTLSRNEEVIYGAGSYIVDRIEGDEIRPGEQVRVVEQQPPTEEDARPSFEEYMESPEGVAALRATSKELDEWRASLSSAPGPPEPTQGNEWDRATEREALDRARNAAHLPPGSSDAQVLVDHGFAAGVEFARAEERRATVDAVVKWTRAQHWFPATPAGVAAAIERQFGPSLLERFKGAARDTGGRSG